MGLKSAYDDLRERTLAKIEGVWGKLVYVADRRSTEAGYEHWGFERKHGTVTARNAFARAHQSLVGTILRTRLRLLVDDVEHSRRVEGVSSASYVRKLTGDLYRLLPSGCSKATELHLASVLRVLSILQDSQAQSALQFQSPDQSLPPPGDASGHEPRPETRDGAEGRAS